MRNLHKILRRISRICRISRILPAHNSRHQIHFRHRRRRRRHFRLKDSQIAQNPCAEFEEIAEICESYQPICVRQTHPDDIALYLLETENQ